MSDRIAWVKTRARWAWGLLVTGAVVLIGGVIAELVYSNAQHNYRTFTGVGIALTVIGAERVIRYQRSLSDERVAKRLAASERDERTVTIRNAAGFRAYVASAVIVYAGLSWVSLEANRSLLVLEGDALWNFLAAAVLVPAGVYITSTLIDERRF